MQTTFNAYQPRQASSPAPAVPPAVYPACPHIEHKPAPDSIALELEGWGCFDLAHDVRAGLVDCHAVTLY